MIGKTVALCAMLVAGAALAADVDDLDEPAPNPVSCPRGEILRVKLHTCVPKGGSLDITSRGKGWVVENEDGVRVRHQKVMVHHEPRREPVRPYKVQVIQDKVKFVPLPDPPAAVAVAPVTPEPIVPKTVRVIPLSEQSSAPLSSGPPSWAGTLTRPQ